MGDFDMWVNESGDVVHPNAPSGAGGNGFFKTATPRGYDLSGIELAPAPSSPAGRNVNLTASQMNGLANGAKTSAGTVDEVPTFPATKDNPFVINADGIVEFFKEIRGRNGSSDEVGHMSATLTWDSEVDANDNIVKVNLVVKTEIVRPQLGLTRASPADKALIEKAVQLCLDHEGRHRDIAVKFYTKMVNTLKGTKGADLEKNINKWDVEYDKAQALLDEKEGKLEIVFDADGKPIDVKTGPVLQANPAPAPKKP